MRDGYILIAGGAGYIGSHVNKQLHAKGYATAVLDNLMYGHREFVKWSPKCNDISTIVETAWNWHRKKFH